MSKLDDFLELARKKGLSEKERLAELKRLGFKPRDENTEQFQESPEGTPPVEEKAPSDMKVVVKRKGNVIRRRKKVVKTKAPKKEEPEENLLRKTGIEETLVEVASEKTLLEIQEETPSKNPEGLEEILDEEIAAPEKPVEAVAQSQQGPNKDPEGSEVKEVLEKEEEKKLVSEKGVKPKKKKRKKEEDAKIVGFIRLPETEELPKAKKTKTAVAGEEATVDSREASVAPKLSLEEREAEERKKVSKKKKAKARKRWVVRDLRKEMNDYLAGGKGPSDDRRFRKKHRKEKREKKTEVVTAPSRAIKRVIKILDEISVGELAKRMGIKLEDIFSKLEVLGVEPSADVILDADTAELVAAEFSYNITDASKEIDDVLSDTEDNEEELVPRPPVVTVMGHVDHGKTLLLDAIRKSNVADGEAGGITQHVGAYEVIVGDDKKIVFIDTPGHEAFTEMRARGAQVTDIVVLVVAADDGVMPQTIEAINHAKAAEVPIIVALNKIDKPQAQPEKVRQALTEHGLISEGWGGETLFAEVSAKTEEGIDGLLEMILLQAEMMDLKGNPTKRGRGIILESGMDKSRGITATVIVKRGRLKKGDYFVVGDHYGKIRSIMNDKGKMIKEAGPSSSAIVLGFSDIPEVGEIIQVVKNEKEAKQVASYRHTKVLEERADAQASVTLDELYEKIREGEVTELNLIVKADVMGSLKAVCEALNKLGNEEVKVRVVHEAVGGIIESDINLATASNAIVVGFNVRPEPKARTLAKKEGIEIRVYSIIYDVIDDITKALTGLLVPKKEEKVMGRAEVRATFSVPKIGMVAGCFVVEGEIPRNAFVHLLRENVVVYEGKISSLKRFKDDVKTVQSGYECGLGIENFNDIKVGDVIEAYVMEDIAVSL
jgi:translation initiation factor IF-2